MCPEIVVRPRYWTTASVDSDRASTYWVNTVCSELVELEVKTDRKRDFQASMLQKTLGCVSLNFIDTRTPQDAWRTRESIRRTREPRFDLLYVRTGTVHFEHYGRSFVVGDSQCVLIDTVTAVAPGSFRADWAGRSMTRTPRSIPDYDDIFDPIRKAKRATFIKHEERNTNGHSSKRKNSSRSLVLQSR